jgi:hypothetical protein
MHTSNSLNYPTKLLMKFVDLCCVEDFAIHDQSYLELMQYSQVKVGYRDDTLYAIRSKAFHMKSDKLLALSVHALDKH